MSEARISDQEIKAVRWVEKIMTPVLIAGIISLTTCMYSTTQAVDALKTESKGDAEFHKETKDKISDMRATQNGMALQINTMEARQESIREDMTEVKEQSKEILRILQTNGHNHESNPQ